MFDRGYGGASAVGMEGNNFLTQFALRDKTGHPKIILLADRLGGLTSQTASAY